MKPIFRLFSVFALIYSVSLAAKDPSKDPFKAMIFHKLDNGMQIILAPNHGAKNVMLKLKVGFGREAEKQSQLQAGHVLEHMLFKDGSIEGNKSYLELIKEVGGDVNAYVTDDHTAYHTNIPAEKATWIVDRFKSMVFKRKIEQKELVLGKASVELEIGKPFILNRWLNANPFGRFLNSYFPGKDFNEYQFGIKDFPYSREDEKINLKSLSLLDVKAVYDDYYYPGNMTLYVTGNFDPKLMLSSLKEKFADVPARNGLSFNKAFANKKGDTYIKTSSNFTGDQSRIWYGTLLYKRSASELLALHAYLKYVAHRLMIELRNKKGETYSASAFIKHELGAGIGAVTFATPSEKYEKNKKYLIDLIEKEAARGEISDEDINKATDLYLKSEYEISDVDAAGVMTFAELAKEFRDDFAEDRSPYQILSTMRPLEFRTHLKKVFKEEGRYLKEDISPLFFAFDQLFVFFGSIMAAIFLFKKLWHNSDELGEKKWQINTFSTPGMVIEILTMFVYSWLFCYIIERPIENLYEHTMLYTSSIFLNSYLTILPTTFIFVGVFMKMMSSYPKKFFFNGKCFTVKSLILKSYSFEATAIDKVTLIKPWQKFLFKGLNSKFYIMSICTDYVLRSSLLIHLKDGQNIYLNFWNAKEVKALIEEEIEKLKKEKESEVISNSAA